MVKPGRIALGAAIMLLGALAACSSLWGFDDLSLLPPDASTDAARADALDVGVTDADAGGGDTAVPCVPALPPAKPTKDGDGDASVEIVFALHTLDLGLDAGALVGFDLDKVCTCPGPSSCNLPSSAMDGEACDHPAGRDIGSAGIFAELAAVDTNLSEGTLNDDISRGKFTFLMRLSNYNGSANDSQVTLEFFNSSSIESPVPPAWDGSDTWYIYQDSVVSGTDGGDYVSAFIDFDAYVSNFTVVGHFADGLTLRLRPDTGGNDNYLELPVSGSVITATLDPQDVSAPISSGTFSARMPSDAVLSSVQVLENAGQFLCGNNVLYKFLAGKVCSAQDIMVSSKNDNTDASCNAISFAIGFTATAAALGGRSTPAQVDAECPDGWSPTCGM